MNEMEIGESEEEKCRSVWKFFPESIQKMPYSVRLFSIRTIFFEKEEHHVQVLDGNGKIIMSRSSLDKEKADAIYNFLNDLFQMRELKDVLQKSFFEGMKIAEQIYAEEK